MAKQIQTKRLNDQYVAKLLNELRKRNQTVTTVESCTGGLLSGRITDIPGSSDVLKQAYITYCDKAKHKMVDVKKATLKKHTAVSRQTAAQMAKGGAKKAKADACLSVTGYAGPSDDPSTGLVYIGCYYAGKTTVKKLKLIGDRRQVRDRAVDQALLLLEECLHK